MEGPPQGAEWAGADRAIRFLHGFVIELHTTYLKLSDEASEGLGVDSIWFRRSLVEALVWLCGLRFLPTHLPSPTSLPTSGTLVFASNACLFSAPPSLNSAPAFSPSSPPTPHCTVQSCMRGIQTPTLFLRSDTEGSSSAQSFQRVGTVTAQSRTGPECRSFSGSCGSEGGGGG